MPQTVARLLTVLLVWSAVLAFAQSSEGPAPAPAPKAQFFAGAVTALDEQHITVSRTLVGRPPENRTFLINPDTKWNKAALKIKSRVTVRYQRMPEGDLALEIQIRHSRT
ncbi:MAG: hypothetical protein JO033_05115 [Acidobacteriaceae bacterium]|nr:hypothetical protein [Acidobacteriaceae bacterium]MBV9500342.1 hypothetical protein [Acidobacteriaceae bacterium]